MIYEIIKIHPKKKSANGNIFIRVEFKNEEGTWYKTDICPDYRNYKAWKPYLNQGVGTKLKYLKLKDENTVDADSVPHQHFSDEDLFRMGVIQ